MLFGNKYSGENFELVTSYVCISWWYIRKPEDGANSVRNGREIYSF
jgi:hypothetical protein